MIHKKQVGKYRDMSNSDSNDYIRNRLSSGITSNEIISYNNRKDNDLTTRLLMEIVDELRQLNHKPIKYKIDSTNFTLGA